MLLAGDDAALACCAAGAAVGGDLGVWARSCVGKKKAIIITRRLVLIWLTQQTPMGSVKGCPDRHSLRPCGSFKANSPPRKPASNTSRSAAGPRASSVPVAEIGGLMIW